MIKIILILLIPVSIISALPVEEYIRMVLENNPSLKTAYYKHQSQLELRSASGYLPDPMLSAGYSLSPVETRLGAQEWRISARQDLPWAVIFGDDEKIADYSARSGMEDYENMKEKIIFEIKRNYYLIKFKKQEISLTKEMLENYRSLLRIKDMNNAVSVTSVSSNIMFGNKIDLMEENIMQLTNDLSLLNIGFNLLLNRNTDEPVETDDLILKDPSEDIGPSGGILQNRSIRSLDLQIEKKKYEIIAQERKRFPSLSLGFDYLFVNERKDMMVEDSGKDAYTASVTFNLPINFKRTDTVINKTVLEKKTLESSRSAEENRLISEFEKSRLKVEDLKRKTGVYEKIVSRYEGLSDIELQMVSTGSSSVEKYIMLINDKYSSIIMLEKLRTDLAVEYSYLNYLLSKNKGKYHENNN